LRLENSHPSRCVLEGWGGKVLYSYETSPERDSEPQNSRITNCRISKDGFAMLNPF
jgi:hypothetical protein